MDQVVSVPEFTYYFTSLQLSLSAVWLRYNTFPYFTIVQNILSFPLGSLNPL